MHPPESLNHVIETSSLIIENLRTLNLSLERFLQNANLTHNLAQTLVWILVSLLLFFFTLPLMLSFSSFFIAEGPRANKGSGTRVEMNGVSTVKMIL